MSTPYTPSLNNFGGNRADKSGENLTSESDLAPYNNTHNIIRYFPNILNCLCHTLQLNKSTFIEPNHEQV